MNKRLLVLAYFFPPLAGGGVHRVLSFTRYLPAHGWDCTVVCAGEDDYWVRDDSLSLRVSAGTEVIRVRGGSALSALLKTGRGGATGRRSGGAFAPLRSLADFFLLPDSYAGWSARARDAAAARLAAGGVDALLTTSPPDSVHLAGAALAERFHVPWVADFRDPWIGLHFRTPPTAWHRARHRAMERTVLERADLVLTASRTHADRIVAEGRATRALEHLPNGFEPHSAPDAAAAPNAAPAAGAMFHVVFTGTLSLMPDAFTLLEALREWFARAPEARERVRVTLAGPYDTSYESRAAALGLAGVVRFPGALAHAESRALQRGADVLLLWKPPGEGYATMVPGKLYEYLDAARPVVALLPSGDEAAGLVRRAGGLVTPQGDASALARELETRYMAWKADGRATDARPDWLDEHARPVLAARLAARLDGLTGGNPWSSR
ncbi:MAG: glycosyltransferase [Candidatus Eisenbacteria bacterium]|uniref:Glycosyltransferase n=1 Tax=Eiseniibacteriota bacterium TaxID=2212470 RepID=A0A933SJ49_UNCEI|nr:glycosyltransferase [Candidatus Eisenbacteria bacterium]